MFNIQNISRLQAVVSHLIVSLILFAILAYLICYVWYPGIFFWIDGGLEGMQLIAGVDIILGPVLTWVIFKPGKLGLKKDIALIATIQISCLMAGIYIVHDNRTLAFIFSDGYFYTIKEDTFTHNNKEEALKTIRNFPGAYPKKIYVDIPLDKDELLEVRKQAAADGKLVLYNHTKYRPMDENIDRILLRGFSAEEMSERYPEKFDPWLNKQKFKNLKESIRVYDLVANYALTGHFVVIDEENFKILDYWSKVR